MIVFEGLRLGDLRWSNMAAISVEFDLNTLLRCTCKAATGVFTLEFGPVRPKTVECWSERLVKNLKIESKLGFQFLKD